MEQEVVLTLDRSHSMCFDLSGEDWHYPPPIDEDVYEGLTNPPHKNKSRWAKLQNAIDTFVDTVSTVNLPPKVSVVTWASEITKSSYEYSITGQTSPMASVDLALTSSLSQIKTIVADRKKNPMLGGTNCSAGIDKAIEVLTGPDSKPLSKKVIILMTDGEWNQGRDPSLAAADALAKGIVIHTITFLPNVNPAEMQEIAELTGGKHYYATDAASLDDAFKELATNLPVVLTQ